MEDKPQHKPSYCDGLDTNIIPDVQARAQPLLRLDGVTKSSRKRKQNQFTKYPMVEACKCKKNVPQIQ